MSASNSALTKNVHIKSRVVTIDVANIVANSSVDTDITFYGAKPGMIVHIAPVAGTFEAGLSIYGWVITRNSIRVRTVNSTAGAVNPASQNFRITLL